MSKRLNTAVNMGRNRSNPRPSHLGIPSTNRSHNNGNGNDNGSSSSSDNNRTGSREKATAISSEELLRIFDRRERKRAREGSPDGFVYTDEVLREMETPSPAVPPAYVPFVVERSDGKAEVMVKKKNGNITIPNRPTDKQLDQTPNEKGEKDYYVELQLDHPRSKDWRSKLGTWIIDRIGTDVAKKGE